MNTDERLRVIDTLHRVLTHKAKEDYLDPAELIKVKLKLMENIDLL